MKVEVLHILDCPNWVIAGNRLEVAVAAVGRMDVVVEFVLLLTPADTTSVAFSGSPTFTVDGLDLFPSSGRITELGCRIYETPAGLDGLPTVNQLIDALALRV